MHCQTPLVVFYPPPPAQEGENKIDLIWFDLIVPHPEATADLDRTPDAVYFSVSVAFLSQLAANVNDASYSISNFLVMQSVLRSYLYDGKFRKDAFFYLLQ